MAVRHRNTFADRIQGLGFDAYSGLFGSMSVERASALGSALFRRIGPMLRVQKVAQTNLALAFPDMNEEERKTILHGMWDNLGRTAAEFPHMKDLRAYEPGGRVEVIGAERLDEAAASGKGAVLISGHFANWELMAAAIVQRDVTCHVAYRPTNNGYVNRRIIDTRNSYGVELQAAKGKTGGVVMLRALARGEMVAILADQKNNEGRSIPFFGHDAMTADIPARFARRYGCPIIPMAVKRLPNVRFEVTIHDPIEQSYEADEDIAIAATTANVNAFLEARIREAPEQWFWVHRRWPAEVYSASGEKG